MDAHQLQDWLQTGSAALGLVKSASAFLPKGAKRTEVENRLREAEELLAKSNAALAKKLGYRICKCTWPPQIMLWKESEKADICPACGHRESIPNMTFKSYPGFP